MSKIGIITYDHPHRKTQDLVYKLLLNGYSDLHLIVLPWEDRKPFIPIFQHRPSNCVDIPIDKLCDCLGIQFTNTITTAGMFDVLQVEAFDHILIGGAGILHSDFAEDFDIINSHPGYLPNVRGLDALKWAIYDGQPIGVTTHYISENTDEGDLIAQCIIPVFFEDTFHSVAQRLYEAEIEMLACSINVLETERAPYTNLADPQYKAHKRMSHHDEMIMMERFEAIRKKSKSHRG